MRTGWKKPKMIVVARGSTEENVLDACKDTGIAGAIDTNYFNCTTTGCNKCHNHIAS